MEYNFNELEQKWQQHWKNSNAYKVSNQSDKPKFYVLDMFPYPSGAGLHVGHPLGYITSDIFARYKRLKGFNVLHPMGFDSFGLPAEQYALETGQHPATTTEKNIATFKAQLDKIGFCYDWDRAIRTSDPSYYKWTQWIFLELYNSYFDTEAQKAKPITALMSLFEKNGGTDFSASDWSNYSTAQREEILMQHRLAFSKYGEVNWCEALGTVLANDEVVNGVSERGGHPVEKKKMRQWYLRITAYADRLLQGLETVAFSESMKEMQRNWIGKSVGANINFSIINAQLSFEVYTTRPDTIFGVDFMVAAPELEWIAQIVTPEQQAKFDAYVTYVKSRSEIERMAEKKITGCFTGAFAINPFNGKQIPIWVSEYVLAGYGTGAIMAVPCGDERDFKFAQHFNITITNILGNAFDGTTANPTKEVAYENSDFINGMTYEAASNAVIEKLEAMGIGNRKVNYRMRDAGFSRQRYWGEPFPIKWVNGVPQALTQNELPIELPYVENYGPGPEGQGPLANIETWTAQDLEVNTMPGYAGSSWYFLRYMDPNNETNFCDKTISDYWNQVDLYVGGTEHAVGHLLYSRMWTKVLYDLGHIGFDEPFKRLLNQGMITYYSYFIEKFECQVHQISEMNAEELANYVIEGNSLAKVETEFRYGNFLQFRDEQPMAHNNKNYIIKNPNGDIERIRLKNISELVDENATITKDKFTVWYNSIGEENMPFKLEEVIWHTRLEKDGNTNKFVKLIEVSDKMSKSKYNTVNPDDLCEKYGADTFRMYEMFLGPVELSKPWDTKGIEGVHRFLKKLWRLFFDEQKGWIVTDAAATDAELKVLHKAIKKIEDDTQRLSLNTAVSAFMILVNELSELKCNKKTILETLTILIAPYAPHIAAELYSKLHNDAQASVLDAAYPILENKYLVETTKEYPVSINGKMRTTMVLDVNMQQKDIEPLVLENEIVQKWIDGKPIKKFIFVNGKMINVVI